jgi:tetratricopeptide (TPR) repeat protein
MREPDAEVIEKVKELRKQALFLDAWELLKSFSPPEEWTNPEHRVVGARMLRSLGDEGRERKILLKMWRHKTTRHVVREDLFWKILNMRGAFLAWQWLEKHPPTAEESEEEHHDHPGIQAWVLGKLRDFERAEQLIRPLLLEEPGTSFAWSVQADLLEWQDRWEESLAAAEKALSIQPTHLSSLHSQFDMLMALGREKEAIEKLEMACARTQSASLLRTLAAHQIELEQHEAALASLARHEVLQPFMDADLRRWQAGRSCDLASAMGNHEEALKQARIAGEHSGFYKKVADYLEKTSGQQLTRRILPVGFVAQHHVTCAPATVSAVAAFLGKPVGHLELADEICYDGTPHYRERDWAEKNGWAVRELRVTVDAAKQLIDRGIPVILTMVYPDSAHAQAIIGYDEYRQVLFVRDPSDRTTTEFLALEALEGQAPFGPRGLAMVPAERESLFDGLELPERHLYDLKHAVDSALTRHDRAAALATLEVLRQKHPEERLRWHVELELARYDDSAQARLDGLEAMLKLHPQTVNWQIDRLYVLRELRGREVFTEELRKVCAEKDSHPLLWRMLARELHWEARHVAEATRWLRRYHRSRMDATAVLTSANLLWDDQRREEATVLYRLASCLNDKNESFSMSYFRAARWVRRTDEALALLRRRFDKDGHLSSQPAISLAEALDMINRTDEAVNVLKAACERRPDDMDLALEHARWLLRTGQLESTREVLVRVKDRTAPGAWHRTDAQLARQEGDLPRQLEAWRKVLVHEPQAMDAHRNVANLLEQLESRQTALDHIRAACDRFPFNWHLHDMWSDWTRSDSPEAMEAAARELLRIDPRSGMAWREIAISMKNRQRFAEAHEAMQQAYAFEPQSVWHFNVLGGVFEAEKRIPEAKNAYRKAVSIDPDAAAPMNALLSLCKTQPERLAELRHIQGELVRQVTNGDGVLEFAELARNYLDLTELEAFLRHAHEQRPDLWQTWVTLAELLRETDRVDEAVQLMQTCCERFPLLPRVWTELAECHGARPDRKQQIEAAMHVRELNPGWGWGMRNLAEALKKDARYEEALSVMQQAVRHAPHDGRNHGWVAEIAWHLGQKRLAFDHLKKAVDLDPGYGWAWERLEEWGPEVGEKTAARKAAEALTQSRPNEARSWLTLADLMTQPAEFAARLSTLDRAIAAAPHALRAYDEKARVLALAGRFDEAFAACEAHPDPVRPAAIIAREAWILWQKHDQQAAVSRMRSALDADPAMVWGWRLMAEWHQELKDLPAEEEAITRLSQLEPGEAAHLGSLGDVRERRGDTAGAMTAYARALEIEPTYAFGLRKLFDHHCSKAEFARAKELLDAARPHFPAIENLSRLCLWHWRQRQYTEVRALVLEMAAQEQAFHYSFNRIMEEIRLSHVRNDCILLKNELAKAIRSKQTRNSHAAAFYVSLVEFLGKVPARDVMREVPAHEEGGETAFVRLLNHLAERWEKAKAEDFGQIRAWWERRRVNRFLREHREAWHSRDEIWGTVGYVLHTMKRSRQVVEWLSDWRERSELEPYMLNNLFFSLQDVGNREEAAAVLARGLELPRHNDTTMRFHLYAALEDLLASREAEARRHLEVVHKPELSPFSVKVLDLANALLHYQPGKPARHFDEGASHAVEVFLNANKDSRLGRDYVTRVCRHIARHNRGWGPLIWLFFKRHGKLSSVLFAAGLIAVARLTR